MSRRVTTLALVLSLALIALIATPVGADNAFSGYWSGQETFSINSVLGGPPESGVTEVPPLVVTADGVLYTVGSSTGGLGLSGIIDANGNFAGIYITSDGTRFPSVTGIFTTGHATLTKQPVIPNGTSGVNITFELVFTGKLPASNVPTKPVILIPSSGDGFSSFISNLSPVQLVTVVVAAIAALGLLTTMLRLLGRALTPRPRARYDTGRVSRTQQPSGKILRRGRTYGDVAPPAVPPSTRSAPSSQVPKLIGPEDGAGGTVISGGGAYGMPVNQGKLMAQAGVTKVGVGAPWNNGVLDQPDANYDAIITPSWPTVSTIQPYSDHFFINFSNPAPADAYFTWKIIRPPPK
jgi:hypothetical protein